MGMFDHVRLEMKLPDEDQYNGPTWFQTKSLYRMMEGYRIAPDGRLWHKSRYTDYEYLFPMDGEMELHNGTGNRYMATFSKGHLKSIVQYQWPT